MSKDRKNISELAPELGVSAAQLYKWRKESEDFGAGSFPGNGNVKQTPEQEHISALEKKLNDSELELEILFTYYPNLDKKEKITQEIL